MGWEGRGVLFGGGDMKVTLICCLPLTKSGVWNQAEPARAWPEAARGLLLQTRLILFLFLLLAHWAHGGWCGRVRFLETLWSQLGLFAHSTPHHRPGPVPPPSPRWQMNGGFNEHGRGRWPGGSEDALTCREGAKGRAHAGPGLGSSQAHAASILILGER